jgi:DNA-binding NarL/FixJ family response regulator
MNKNISILLIEASSIISEGLAGVLEKSGLKHQLSFAASLEDIELLYAKKKYELIIVNPSFILNNAKAFNSVKNLYPDVKWIGLVYAYYEPSLLSIFDTVITISDTPESISSAIKKLLAQKSKNRQSRSQELLSERETEVLKLLARGLANKEIADKLNISTNTVITHRKNISQKTGIKTVSGLTIYAVVQNMVSIESLSE